MNENDVMKLGLVYYFFFFFISFIFPPNTKAQTKLGRNLISVFIYYPCQLN